MALILDNGAYEIKLGSPHQSPNTYQNCVSYKNSDVLVAPTTFKGTSEIMRPFDRGVMVDPKLQEHIWKKILSSYSTDSLFLTCPPYSPATCRRYTDEVVLESLGFGSMARLYPCYGLTGIIIDMGFSSTTIVPSLNGIALRQGIKKVNLGGKVLTNYLKEQISFRHYLSLIHI